MMKILIANDDGIQAKGIRTLIDILKPLGDVTVVAPDSPQSGMGHAITVNRPLRLRKIVQEKNYQEFSCNGTPVDCVKLGMKVVMEGQRPDLVVSGINHGSNASSNVIYSGTMGAAIEAAMEGIPSIGFSLLDYAADANFEEGRRFILEIVQRVIKTPPPPHVCLNVNIPNVAKEEIKGIQVCRQAQAYWREEYISRKDPWNGDYYWLSGEFETGALEEGTDLYALSHNYLSVVPIQYDLTDFKAINSLSYINL